MGSPSTTMGSPCGACKFLRRKCAPDCVFAPYFSSEHGPARFAAIHKVFGASNASKLLSHVPPPDRSEAVVTLAYEAQARLRDPVYGCVSHIFALQQQVASLQTQLMQAKVQIAQGMVGPLPTESPCRADAGDPLMASYMYGTSQSMSPQSSIDCVVDHRGSEACFNDDLSAAQVWSKRRARHDEEEPGELHTLASRMMRN